MELKIYPALVDEATKLLPRLRSALILHSQNDEVSVNLTPFESEIRSFALSSQMIGRAEMAEVSLKIGDELHRLSASTERPYEGTFRLLDLLAKLEALLLKAGLDDDDFALDIDGFVDESFGLLQLNDASEVTQPTGTPDLLGGIRMDALDASIFETDPPAAPKNGEFQPEIKAEESDFEIDQELLDVFAEEAESLLKNMEDSLLLLADDPNNSEALWEIRRNAHTFKGSAGIVGLKQLSQLAHRIEDLLDKLAETKNSSGASVFTLLSESTRSLKALTSGDISAETTAKISALHAEFDKALDSLNDPPKEVPASAALAEAATAEPSIEVPAAEMPVPVQAEMPANAHPQNKVFDVVSAPKPPQSRSVVRVSLGRLDELVALVRDMIVTRSAFDQKLRELDRQIEDLHNTTRRLHSTSSKLEIDFEASLLMSDGYGQAAKGNSDRADGNGSFDELEFDRYTDFHQSTRDLAETTNDTFSINTALDSLRGNFELLFDEQRRLVDELQDKLMRIRMVEFGTLSNRLQRAVRVTCEEENKKAQIALVNEKLEVDTQILDNLIEPLMHLLKNAVVHGIETPDLRRMLGKPEIGLVEVAIFNEETHVSITVTDDGRGINPQALKEKALANNLISYDEAAGLSDEDLMELVFLPGLTTATKLNLSAGRGVGMSIVRESIEAQHGSISIESVPQRGTTFRIRVPQRLAVTNVVLVKADDQTYALPNSVIKQVVEMDEETGSETDTVSIDGSSVPVTGLASLVNSRGSLPFDGKTAKFVILTAEDTKPARAITVDDIVRSEEVVIKPLLHPLDNIKGVLGAAILGNGDLVPILDLPSLLKKRPLKRIPVPEAEIKSKVVNVLVVDDSPSVRLLTSKLIEKAGWIAKTAKDGIDALEQLKSTSTPPSLILTDIEMPRMDGYELTSALRRSEEFGKIPIVMITSRSADKHREKAEESGVTRYLTKPYDEADLISTVKELTA